MKIKTYIHRLRISAILLTVLAVQPLAAWAQGTSFTYQGRLDDAGIPANGSFDLEFRVFNAADAGTQLGGVVTAAGTPVSDGVFSVTLDFGASIFTGPACWLNVAVRTGGSGAAYVNIVPRQSITPVPYAIFAGGASASGLTGTLPPGALAGTYRGAIQLTNAANAFAGHGGALTNLNASALVGTVADARLSSSVAMLNRPVQVFAGSSNSFLGTVGIGTDHPAANLHLDSPATTTLRLQSSPAAVFGAARIEFWSDPQNSPTEWRPATIVSTDNGGYMGGLAFLINGRGYANRETQVEAMRIVDGNLGIGTTRPVTRLDVAGEATMTACNITSDRNAKEQFTPVDIRTVLDKVTRIPITEWQYKSQSDARHIGPMAQDFREAFGLGRDEKHITTVDADGIAFAAIQGLNAKMEDTLNQNNRELKALRESVAILRELVSRRWSENQPAAR